MSVLIRGMEMPKICGECKFFAWKQGVGNHCAIDDRITFHATLDGLDVRYEKRRETKDYITDHVIKHAPTIIEAAEGE